jgi:hypothetical protein
MSDRDNLYRDIFNGKNKERWEKEQKNKKMKKFETLFLKYGHWSFLFSSLFEAGEGRWLTAAALMFLFINYQFLRKE